MPYITSFDDPRIAAYRNLRDRTLRGESIFITEGDLVTRRLIASRHEAESVLVDEEHADEFQRLAAGRFPVYVTDAQRLRGIAGFPFHMGVLGLGRRSPPVRLPALLAETPADGPLTLVVCPEITKPENLGLVFRTAAALGVEGVLLGERCCDPFSRRALRVSMGGVFQVPFGRSGSVAADLAHLVEQHGMTLVATVLDPTATPLAEFAWPPRAAIVMGNEFYGLEGQRLLADARRVTIPMAGDVDSLNLGVAAGIFLHAHRASRGASPRRG